MEHLYEQLANELAHQITQGSLPSGSRLPGVRRFAKEKGVSVATAVAAYHQLEDSGYVEARPRSGVFVRQLRQTDISEPGISHPQARPSPVNDQQMVMELLSAANRPGVIQLGAAVPDNQFLPTQALEKALTKTARQQRQSSNQYAFPPGNPALRQQLAQHMTGSGCSLSAEQIVVTSGCQEALTLALRATTQPGDVVAIESPTFYGLLQIIESLQLKAIEIPTHPRSGISLEALSLALEQWPIKACVLVPTYSNPLGYCLSDERKKALVGLLGEQQIPLIEDDIYGDLGFNLQRAKSCKAFDEHGLVLYCSSFSKTLSPGLRVGWIAAGRYQKQIEYLKYVTNLATPSLNQLAVAELLSNGSYQRHLKRTRQAYAVAVKRMIEAVNRHFPPGTRITQPEGGFVIWVELPMPVDSFELAQKLLEENVSIAPGPIFSATQKYRRFLRISCACEWGPATEKALARIAAVLIEDMT